MESSKKECLTQTCKFILRPQIKRVYSEKKKELVVVLLISTYI